MRKKQVFAIIEQYATKKKKAGLKELTETIFKRKMVNEIPSGLSEKKRNKLIFDEFLIKKGNKIIISGAGRIILLLFNDDFKKELMKIIKRGYSNQFEEVLYFHRKLMHFKLKPKDFDKEKLLS
jgi:hypothetical protein